MNKFLFSLALSAVAFSASAQTEDAAPAFPGAEGFGRYVTGGRGGAVYHVTNLNDSGEGSFRWAVEKSGKRTIVFDVAGYIDLKSDLKINNGDLTIAGQTAPEPGITLRYRTIVNQAANVIVRFIRIRRSQVKDVNDGADAFWGRQRANIMLDHCSFSWSCDEVASFYDNRNFTMQWCTVAEGLNNAGHGKGAHGYGGIWGGKGASFHHVMLAHNNNRSPRFNGARYEWTAFSTINQFASTVDAERVDFRNCVNFNWGNGNGCYGGPGGGYINIVNNYYKAGPGTSAKMRVTQVSVGNSGNSTNANLVGYASRYYVNGNYVAAASEPENYDWKGVDFDGGLSVIDGERYIPDAKHLYGEDSLYVKNASGVDCIKLKLAQPVPYGQTTTHSAEVAFDKVLNYVGACLYRDETDARYAEEARTGAVTYVGTVSRVRGILDVIQDPDAVRNEALAAFPDFETNSRPEGFDSDGDGMPDEWESLNGLDPNNAADGALFTLDAEKGWYTNLEVYMNQIVEDIMKAGNADAIESVDEYYPVAKGVPAERKDYSWVAPNKPQDSSAESRVSSSPAISFRYVSLDGKPLDEPQEGISIRQTIYADGSVKAELVIK